MFRPRLGGHLPDKRNKDEKRYNSIATTLSTTNYADNVCDLRKWCSPVEAQFQIGSCVANSTVGALELLQIKNNLPFVDLSRMFLYYNARLMHQAQMLDEGTYINLAFQTLLTIGTCSEKTWNYNVEKVFVRPTWASYREAYVNKISGFYRLDDDMKTCHEQIKHALASGYPIVFGTNIDKDFVYETKSDGLIAMPKARREDVGGHAMLIVGYNSLGQYIVRNSWGPTWADQGYCYIPFKYLDETEANDFWVPTLTVNI